MGLRERKKARLRQLILDTAVDSFRKRGYESTTVEEVARRVEISQPTFYKYFAGKDAILRDVAAELLERWALEPEVALEAEASSEERLRRLYAEMGRWMMADRPLGRAIVLADALNPLRVPLQSRSDPSLCRRVEEILAEGQRRGEITMDIAATRLAENLIAMQITACLAWGAGLPARRSLGETLEENLDFFLRAARADGA